LGREEGLPGLAGQRSTFLDQKGVLWLGTTEGIWRYDTTRSQPPARFTAPGLPTKNIRTIAGTGDGAVWFQTPEALVRYNGTSVASLTNSMKVYWMVGDPKKADRLWCTGDGAGLIRFDGTNFVRFTRQNGLLSDTTGVLNVGADGQVWLAEASNGIA